MASRCHFDDGVFGPSGMCPNCGYLYVWRQDWIFSIQRKSITIKRILATLRILCKKVIGRESSLVRREYKILIDKLERKSEKQ